jgi:uncharacterized protein (DUF302 family)
MADKGLVTVESRFGARETIDRLAEAVLQAGLNIFARIDHAAGAHGVGASLRPTELLIFGNPKGGTPLMQDRQTAGIDLPVKALAWEDDRGKAWLTYNSAEWIADRHDLGAPSHEAVAAIAAGMKKLVAAASGTHLA